jgi:hypothetical protein
MKDFLAQMKIFESDRAARADLERVLIVGNRNTLLGRENRRVTLGDLMSFTAHPGGRAGP